MKCSSPAAVQELVAFMEAHAPAHDAPAPALVLEAEEEKARKEEKAKAAKEAAEAVAVEQAAFEAEERAASEAAAAVAAEQEAAQAAQEAEKAAQEADEKAAKEAEEQAAKEAEEQAAKAAEEGGLEQLLVSALTGAQLTHARAVCEEHFAEEVADLEAIMQEFKPVVRGRLAKKLAEPFAPGGAAPPPAPPASAAAAPGFGASNFKPAYDAARCPEYQDELLGSMRKVVVDYVSCHDIPQAAQKKFLEELQGEYGSLNESINSSAQKVWTSMKKL